MCNAGRDSNLAPPEYESEVLSTTVVLRNLSGTADQLSNTF
jgi:hypothetical protein